jgi:hypothetical protein
VRTQLGLGAVLERAAQCYVRGVLPAFPIIAHHAHPRQVDEVCAVHTIAAVGRLRAPLWGRYQEDLVLDWCRDVIASELGPGSICLGKSLRTLGVSITPVREAINELRAAGAAHAEHTSRRARGRHLRARRRRLHLLRSTLRTTRSGALRR